MFKKKSNIYKLNKKISLNIDYIHKMGLNNIFRYVIEIIREICY